MEILRHTVNAYSRNLKLMLFFSIPAFLAFLVPLLSPLPTYIAVGGTYLRTSSMPELTQFDMAVMAFAILLSLFLISFAIVAINIVIKSQRTFTQIRTQVIDGIEKYVMNIFWLFLTFELLYVIIGMLAYDWGVQNWLNPLTTLVGSVLLVYAPAALVIDEMRPFRAVEASVKTVMRAPGLFVLWIAVAVAMLSVSEVIALALLPHASAQMLVLVLNSFFLLPFLIVMQTQIYMTKYPLAR